MKDIKSLLKEAPGGRAVFQIYRKLIEKQDIRTREAKRAAHLTSSSFLRFAPPGHFYSPIPDINAIKRNKDSLFNQEINQCPGISLREQSQRELFEKLATYYESL